MIVGLTGSLATGKSTLMAMASAHLNWQAWSADAAVAWLYQFDHEFIELLAKKFPSTYSDGVIQKDELIKIILSVPDAMQKLESILHPHLKKLLSGILKKMSGQNIILEIPLLFESGWEDLCDYTIVLTCDEAIQKQRLARKNYSSELENFFLKRHWSNEKKRTQADYVIDTSHSFEHTSRNFVDILQKVLSSK